MNKRGAELSMNIIIVAILLILVLVILVGFFIGGFSDIQNRIINVAPGSLETAVQDCQQKCQLAQTFAGEDAIVRSSYCSYTLKFDSDGDGIVDERHHCWSSLIERNCPGVSNVCQEEFPDAVEQLEV